MKESISQRIKRICQRMQWTVMHTMCAINVIKHITEGKHDVMLKWEINTIHKSWFAADAVILHVQRYT